MTKALMFSAVLIALLGGTLFMMPDYLARTKTIGAVTDKHILMDTTPSPRIIFVGGSNVNMGLDSRQVRDSLHMNVVNDGIHAGFGLKFMLGDVQPFIRKGDIIVVMPEYHHFIETQYYYGQVELVSVLFDVYPPARKNVSTKQWMALLKYIPLYAAAKLKNGMINAARGMHEIPGDLYRRHGFNELGDTYVHWDQPAQPFGADPKETGHETVIPEIIEDLRDFRNAVQSNGATFVMLPPVYQRQSYNNRRKIAETIGSALKDNNLVWGASPERYVLDDGLFFNSPYHPTKAGVDVRTSLVIEDLRKYIKKGD